MRKLLKNKTVLITGASGDIGGACADLFAKEGANLILHHFSNYKMIEKFKNNHRKNKIFSVNCDATNEEDVKNQFAKIKKNFKKIDVLVNNVGDLIARKSLEEMDWEYVQKIIDVNLKSAFLFTKYCLNLMPVNSSIIFISSLTARSGKGDRSSAYGLAKGGLLSWSKCLANELGKKGIRVNSLTPGFIKGDFHKRYTLKALEKEHIKRNPLGRIGTPCDVAQAALFYALASDGYISGTNLDICGADYMS